MAGLVESLLSVVPQTYRRDVMVLVCGATMATGWFMFDARVTAAENLAKPVADVQARMVQMEKKQAVTDAKVNDIQASTARIEAKVDALLDTLISQNSRGQLVPAQPGKVK